VASRLLRSDSAFLTAAGDNAFDDILADLDGDVGHDFAEFDFTDLAGELVACGDGHASRIAGMEVGLCAMAMFQLFQLIEVRHWMLP